MCCINRHIVKSSETSYLGGDITVDKDGLYTYLFGGGYCEFKPCAAYADSIKYYYYTKDHLGNVRNVISKNASGTMEELQQTHYYPFGGIIADLSTGRNVQNHLYNGKELDYSNNLYWYDYGARQYDPTRGQFTNYDQHCESYYNTNPLTYCGNNPISRIDPTGMDWYRTEKGNYYWNPKVKSQDDLQEGYTYVGESYFDKNTNMAYRSDGTVLCPDENSGLERMQLQNERSKNASNKYGKEQSAVLLENGNMLVMPDNWNNINTSRLAPGSELTNKHFINENGEFFNVVAHIHTHTNAKQDRMSSADGDFANQRKNLPCFIIQNSGEVCYTIQPAFSNKGHYNYDTAGYLQTFRNQGVTLSFISKQIVKRLNK